jgi:hypothetical protein
MICVAASSILTEQIWNVILEALTPGKRDRLRTLNQLTTFDEASC